MVSLDDMRPVQGSNGSRHSREEADGLSNSPETGGAGSGTSPTSATLARQLRIISYLIIFSILGTLARLGIQWLTVYPGAPVALGVLWANSAGCVVMGFATEIARLSSERPTASRGTACQTIKKTEPAFVGLVTGFCGSLTSFSAFMRDVSLALSNDLPTLRSQHETAPKPLQIKPMSRHGAYSLLAVIAVVFLTVTVCTGALSLGAHIASAIHSCIPWVIAGRRARWVDWFAVSLAVAMWTGVITMTVLPPDRSTGLQSRGSWNNEVWRGYALFACVFAPAGCILRYYLSLRLNSTFSTFPVGTFTVNVLGTAIFGMAYNIQHLPLRYTNGMVGGGRVACQVLQGIMDGFSGGLTTVSGWIVELRALKTTHSYVYGTASTAIALAILVVIMGSVRWTLGFSLPACQVPVS